MSVKAYCMAASAALLLGLAAAPASAQSVDVAFNAGIVSDYVFRGGSQTNNDPAIQGGVDLTYGSFYAGTWASNLDYGDGTQAEWDLYGGYRTEAAGFAWDVGLIHYIYVDAPAGADYDYTELKVSASRAIGPATVGALMYYTPDYFGTADEEAVYVELNAAYSLADKWTVSGAVGNQYLDVSTDFVTWNLGATYALTDNLGLDVRYHDSDLSNSPAYEDKIVASLKVAF